MARILIADDDEPTLAVLEAAVSGWRHETTLVREAAGVAPTVRAYKPELMLLDYQFPTASGAQVLQRVRTMPEGVDLPVIFISGTPVDLIRFNVDESPLVRILAKPVSLDKLRSTIEEMLNAGPAGPESQGIEILK